METTTLTLCLDHLYYLTADTNNQTGYTLEQVKELISQHGGNHKIEATITHPTPPPYTVEWDIEQHQNRIQQNQEALTQFQSQLTDLEEGTEEYTQIQEQISAIEVDITHCEEYIANLQSA